jgi:hypothetical protein
MIARYGVHFLLVLSLALGPAIAALAEGVAGHSAGPTQHLAGEVSHDLTDCEQAAGHPHASMDKGQGHDHAQGHDHSACGAHCLAGLPSLSAGITISSALQPVVLSVPVKGIIVSTASRPPQTLPG